MTRRVAVVLFNLGGPDEPEAVRPFLRNLFSDPAILTVPGPLRWFLAWLISSRRAPVAREIYAKIGGRSPIMPETEAQARALGAALSDLGEVRVFIAMRYWHPRAADVARAVKAFAPDAVVLLPLYPQFSTTTSRSSLEEWRTAARAAGLDAPSHTVCCYPTEPGFIAAITDRLRAALPRAEAKGAARILFSAHGLPEKIVQAGDPYQHQVELTGARVMAALDRPDLDHVVCYQSRVGPLKWIGPSTDAEIERAGTDGVPVVVVPIAFVSEHSETLVELDIEYAELAESVGVPTYVRVDTARDHPAFIDALAGLTRRALARPGLGCGAGDRICPRAFGQCPMGGS